LLITAGVTGMLVVSGWALLDAYQTPAAKECLRRYRSARSAADTAAVDALFPESGRQAGPEAHSCRFIRRTARWIPGR
jgi:hypothetical protein